jgi:ribosomal protein S27AE
MKKCPKCGENTLLTEGQGEGKVKVKCTSCGLVEVRDEKGRKMLTDDVGSGPGQPLMG